MRPSCVGGHRSHGYPQARLEGLALTEALDHACAMDLHELAVHGVVSTCDANRLGLGPYEIGRLCARGHLRRLIRGWNAVRPPDAAAAPWDGETSWERELNRHRLLTAALLRSFGGRVVASHQSALVLHDARLFGVDLGVAHLVRVADSHSRHRRDAVIHPALPYPAVIAPCGLPTVDPAVAAVQIGLIQQGEHRPDGIPSLVAADGLLHTGAITGASLQAALDLFASHPGIAAVREALRHAEARHESVGETRLAAALRVLGYDVEPQVWPRQGGSRADFRIKGEPVIVEFDGLAKYSIGSEVTPEAVRRGLSREKLREDELRLEGWSFVRVQWFELGSLPTIHRKVEMARQLAGHLGAGTRVSAR